MASGSKHSEENAQGRAKGKRRLKRLSSGTLLESDVTGGKR